MNFPLLNRQPPNYARNHIYQHANYVPIFHFFIGIYEKYYHHAHFIQKQEQSPFCNNKEKVEKKPKCEVRLKRGWNRNMDKSKGGDNEEKEDEIINEVEENDDWLERIVPLGRFYRDEFYYIAGDEMDKGDGIFLEFHGTFEVKDLFIIMKWINVCFKLNLKHLLKLRLLFISPISYKNWWDCTT